jgi:hypothetical protein
MDYPLLFYPFTLFRGSPEGHSPSGRREAARAAGRFLAQPSAGLPLGQSRQELSRLP